MVAVATIPIGENLLVEGFAKCRAGCTACGGASKASNHGARNRTAQGTEGACERADRCADLRTGECRGGCACATGSGTNRTANPPGDVARLSS